MWKRLKEGVFFIKKYTLFVVDIYGYDTFFKFRKHLRYLGGIKLID